MMRRCVLLLLLTTVRDTWILIEGPWWMVGLIWAHPDLVYRWRWRLIHGNMHEPLLRWML